MTTNTLPSVKEQVKRWAGGRTAKDAPDKPQRETFAARDLMILGHVGRSTFARTKDGRELRLRGPVMAYQLERAPADAILVSQPVRAADGRVRTDTYLATVQESGTYARLAARKTYRGPKARPAAPIDGLAELRTPDKRRLVQLVPEDDGSPEAIIKGALSKRPGQLWTDSRNAPATVGRLIEVANADGANLRRHNGYTLADWTNVRRWRALLVAAWPLVDAYMAGKPLRCAYEHEGTAPLADTFDLVGTPTCNACVGWEPDA